GVRHWARGPLGRKIAAAASNAKAIQIFRKSHLALRPQMCAKTVRAELSTGALPLPLRRW
ncbi:MAG: hypothetical protein WA516_11150, partial [Candidatus Acidiferrales bacterium]